MSRPLNRGPQQPYWAIDIVPGEQYSKDRLVTVHAMLVGDKNEPAFYLKQLTFRTALAKLVTIGFQLSEDPRSVRKHAEKMLGRGEQVKGWIEGDMYEVREKLRSIGCEEQKGKAD